MADMTPDEARMYLRAYEGDWAGYLPSYAVEALETLAAMQVEHDHGVVDWEQVDGRYEVYNRTRLVSEWRDA